MLRMVFSEQLCSFARAVFDMPPAAYLRLISSANSKVRGDWLLLVFPAGVKSRRFSKRLSVFISLMWSTSSSSNSGTFMVEPIQMARDKG